MHILIPPPLFKLMHKEILDKCDLILKKQGVTNGLNWNEKVFMKYGFEREGKINPNSIKNIIFDYIENKYSNQYSFFLERGFRGKGNPESLKDKFNGKLLYDNYCKYQNGEEITIPKQYLESYLFFLDIPDERKFDLKYPNYQDTNKENLYTNKITLIKKINKPTESELQKSIIKIFSNSSWFLYSLSRNPDDANEEHIVRALLSFTDFRFNNKQRMSSLKLVNPPEFRNYYGTITNYFPKQLIISMTPRTKSKIIFIRLNTYYDYYEDESNHDFKSMPLFLGIMDNFSHNTALGYKAILHRIPNSQIDTSEALRLPIDDVRIPQDIRGYLLAPELDPRFIIIPNNVWNLKKLGRWVDKNINQRTST